MTQVDKKGIYNSHTSDRQVQNSFRSGEFPVAVYGLGKMGLPLAGVFSKQTSSVIGVDIDPTIVAEISKGNCPISTEPGLEQLIKDQVSQDRLTVTSDGKEAAKRANIHIVIVPTVLDSRNSPDLSAVDSVITDIGHGLSTGDIVLVESTIPPKTTIDRIVPKLQETSGISLGEFGVAFCPERTSSGTALRDIQGQYPKIVGGADAESTRIARLIYSEISSNIVHTVSDTTTAELVKLFEGVYRDVNIALANELSTLATQFGVSTREAMAAANQLPMCNIHDPGPGVGGHCIPYYPYFLLDSTSEALPLVRVSREVNESMPGYTRKLLEEQLHTNGLDLDNATILVLGLTYRPGVPEMRASPAIELINELLDEKATVIGCDPLVDPADFGIESISIEEIDTVSPDATVIVTPHDEFEQIEWEQLDPMVIIDGRDAYDLSHTHHTCVTLGGSTTTNETPAVSTVQSEVPQQSDTSPIEE